MFGKINWEKFKLDKLNYEFDFKGNLKHTIYSSIPKDARRKIESFIWDNALSQIRKYLGAAKKEFVTTDGMSIKYLEFGDPSNDAFVFLHGFADVKENNFICAKHLGSRFHVILPDVPGFGESGCSEEHVYNLEKYGIWFQEFFKKVVSKPAHIMGNSLGGGICLQLALLEPALVKSMAVLDSAGVMPLHSESIYDEMNQGKNLFNVNTIEEFDAFSARVFVDLPYMPTPLKFCIFNRYKDYGKWYEKILNDIGNGIGEGRTPEENLSQCLNSHLKEIEIPTLIIWGEGDTLFPLEVAAILHTEIRGSKLVVLEKVGHCPQLEVPRKVIKRYQKFLDSLSDT